MQFTFYFITQFQIKGQSEVWIAQAIQCWRLPTLGQQEIILCHAISPFI